MHWGLIRKTNVINSRDLFYFTYIYCLRWSDILGFLNPDKFCINDRVTSNQTKDIALWIFLCILNLLVDNIA